MHQQSWEQIWFWGTLTLACWRSDSVSHIRQRLPYLCHFILKWNAFPLSLVSFASNLYAGRLFSCTAYGVQYPNVHISAALPLQIDSGAARDPTWGTISYKECHPFGLLYSHIPKLHKGESCVKRITSLFQIINIWWVHWAASHVKLYYSINTHGRALSKSKNSGGCSRCLPDTEITPVTAQSLLLGLDPINPSARSHTPSAVCFKWHCSHAQKAYRARGL